LLIIACGAKMEPYWNHGRLEMAVSLSIKNVSEEIVARLKERAKKNHRSLQGELMALLEEAVNPERLSVEELADEIDALGLRTPDEATETIRELRDER
jgi:plasmid stability protein